MIGRGCLECITRTQADAIKTLYERRPEYDFSKFIYNGSVCKSTVVCDKGHTFIIRYSKIMEESYVCGILARGDEWGDCDLRE